MDVLHGCVVLQGYKGRRLDRRAVQSFFWRHFFLFGGVLLHEVRVNGELLWGREVVYEFLHYAALIFDGFPQALWFDNIDLTLAIGHQRVFVLVLIHVVHVILQICAQWIASRE